MNRNPFFPKFADLPAELAIFPLAGAVIMPGVQLPLNIFEPRYINMVFDTLASHHLLGMIQPVSETGYARDPEIHAIGCAGRITSYSETNDGRIVLVLSGVCRFRVSEELPAEHGYRRVRPDWQGFASDCLGNDGAIPNRDAFLTTLRSYCQHNSIDIPWEDVGRMEDSDLINLLCTHLPLSNEDKQALIETLTTQERATLMRGLLDMASLSNTSATEQRH